MAIPLVLDIGTANLFLEHLGTGVQQAKTDLTRFDRVKNLNMALVPRSSSRLLQLDHGPGRGGCHPAERYEQQDKFWSPYRRHSLELSLP